MRYPFKIVLGFAVLVAIINSCNSDKTNVVKSSKKVSNAEEFYMLTDSLVYSIVTHSSENVDPTENEEFKLFLQENLIRYIFEQLYAKKLIAYDFLTDKAFSVGELKEIEKAEGFSRSKVGKVQFDEKWYFDSNGVLNKRVNCMTFGVESYSNQGNFIGYKALFKIKFQPTVQ